ncbi:hypothetical protein [Lentzea sp. NPDC003310]|uniref:hypothetical protein n=1 Tax=Lentzea sp. NPDC003310 TaxID=3154447 RepID=UPI0033BAB639
MEPYAPRAQRLWRWVDAPQDVEVAGFVALQAVLGEEERARVRAGLSEADQHTLVTFARRIALATLRTGDPAALVAAFEALAAVDVEKVDERDVVWAAALVTYAAQRAGVALSADDATTRATPEVARILRDLSADEVDLPGDWGLREVATPGGVVLLQDDGETYRADSGLALRALRAADLLEAARYPHAEVTVATALPAVWLGEEHADLLRSLTEVAAVHAEPDPGADGRTTHFLQLYLAETTARDAAAIAGEASNGGTAMIGVAAGHRCAVLISRSSRAEAPARETAASLERFRPSLTELLS